MSHVTEPDRGSQGMSVHPRRDEADRLAVAIDGFVVMQERLRVVQQELHEPPRRCARSPLREQRLAAQKPTGLVPVAGEAEPGLERCVRRADVVGPVPIGLLDAQRVEGMVAAVPQPVGPAGLDQGIVEGLRERRRHHEKSVGGEPGDGEIGLDAARGVEELRIHTAAHGDVHVRGRDTVENAGRIAAHHQEFAER